jgi:putative redox protein
LPKNKIMTTLSADVQWNSEMAFKAMVNGHEFMLDLGEDAGGKDLGPRPKPLLLVSLGGCTGMDVISILKKMRVEPDYFNVRLEGEVTEEHPKHFTKIHLIFEFRGKDLQIDKLQKAIDLSKERYCGILYTLQQVIELTSEIKILD